MFRDRYFAHLSIRYTTKDSTSLTVLLLGDDAPAIERNGVASTFLHGQIISRKALVSLSLYSHLHLVVLVVEKLLQSRLDLASFEK
jgi:hypothetical protein